MKKKWLIIMLAALIMIATACSNTTNDNPHKDDKTTKDGKIKIIEYGDFKCPYCKKVETTIMPKLQKAYIDTGKVDYQFVNMAFIGKDSIIGSRAGHAVEQFAPDQYLTFQKLMFEQQPDSEKPWITEKVVDAQIDKLKVDDATKVDIKKAYKTKDSKAWKAAEKDQQQYKDNQIKSSPTVFIYGEKVEDPYDYNSYKKILDKHL